MEDDVDSVLNRRGLFFSSIACFLTNQILCLKQKKLVPRKKKYWHEGRKEREVKDKGTNETAKIG